MYEFTKEERGFLLILVEQAKAQLAAFRKIHNYPEQNAELSERGKFTLVRIQQEIEAISDPTAAGLESEFSRVENFLDGLKRELLEDGENE